MIKKRIDDYYKGFSTCEGKFGMGDLTPFVALFCDIVADSADRIKGALLSSKTDLDRYGMMLNSSQWFKEDKYRFSLVWILIQASLFSDEGISIREIASSIDASPQTAYRRLGDTSKICR